MEQARTHDDFQRESVALQGDFVVDFGFVRDELAFGYHAGFFEDDAEGVAWSVVAEPAHADHAERAVFEGCGGPASREGARDAISKIAVI